jgi:UDP-2-acetamido-2,6-beta-L-arabino-hexul-4-ose reductase
VIFRLPNVFGPGCRPNYNSAVATFAHSAANGLRLNVHDPEKELSLVYVHDVARAMAAVVREGHHPGKVRYREVEPVEKTTVGRLAEAFHAYAGSRAEASIPNVSTRFAKQLYATYLSYLPKESLSYSLEQKSDARGSLAEFFKSRRDGQFFISRTLPGAVRGNHYHHTKAEKFFVVEGEAIISFRRSDGSEAFDYAVSGREFRIVDIPPDHAHSIRNVGERELIVLFWASEVFDPATPDTYPLNVRE